MEALCLMVTTYTHVRSQLGGRVDRLPNRPWGQTPSTVRILLVQTHSQTSSVNKKSDLHNVASLTYLPNSSTTSKYWNGIICLGFRLVGIGKAILHVGFNY